MRGQAAQASCRCITFTELERLSQSGAAELGWHCPFILPFWLQSWFGSFGEGLTPHLVEIRNGQLILGVAPLVLDGKRATFMGGEDVCDFQDVILSSHAPDLFFLALLEHLRKQGITTLELGAVLAGSAVLKHLPGLCQQSGISYTVSEAGNLYQIGLPPTMSGYLEKLKGKHRHEIRRKMRRLYESGDISYRVITSRDGLADAFQGFLHLFAHSRQDKAEFLSRQRMHYFNQLAEGLASQNKLRLGLLSIDDELAASTFGFQHGNTFYLYNNGYELNFHRLSAGTLSKVMAINHCIENNTSNFNLLKGEENYKRHLGGQTIPLKRLTVQLIAS